MAGRLGLPDHHQVSQKGFCNCRQESLGYRNDRVQASSRGWDAGMVGRPYGPYGRRPHTVHTVYHTVKSLIPPFSPYGGQRARVITVKIIFFISTRSVDDKNQNDVDVCPFPSTNNALDSSLEQRMFRDLNSAKKKWCSEPSSLVPYRDYHMSQLVRYMENM